MVVHSSIKTVVSLLVVFRMMAVSMCFKKYSCGNEMCRNRKDVATQRSLQEDSLCVLSLGYWLPGIPTTNVDSDDYDFLLPRLILSLHES